MSKYYYAKSVNGVRLKPEQCPHNEGCRCIEKKCDKCGWNPSVAEQRLAKLKETDNG